MNLVITATGDKDVTDKINKVSVAVREEEVSTNYTYISLPQGHIFYLHNLLFAYLLLS